MVSSRMVLFRSFRGRLAFLLLCTVLPVFAALYSANIARRTADLQEARLEVLRLVRFFVREQENIINETRQLLFIVEKLHRTFGNDDGVFAAVLREIRYRAKRYTNLGVLSPEGRLIHSAVPFTEEMNLSRRDYFKRVLERKTFILGKYQISGLTGKPVIMMAYPSLDPEGKIRAVLTAELEIDWLNDYFGKASLPPDSILNVVDEEGVVIARNPPVREFIGKKMAEAEIVEHMLTKKREGSIEAESIDGTLRIHAFSPLLQTQEQNLFISVGISSKTVYAPAEKIFFSSLLILILAASAVAAIGWYGSGILILNPMNSLQKAFQEIELGRYGITAVPKNATREIRELIDSFNHMAGILEQKNREILETRSAVQRKVEEERIHIARELHDDLGQNLTALRLELRVIRNERDPPRISERIGNLESGAENMIRMVRNIAAQLRPPLIDEFGLAAAIEGQAEVFRKRTGIAVRPEGLEEEIPKDTDTAVALFRILQELLTNVARHSRARLVTIRLFESEGWTVLRVADNGVGMEKDKLKNSSSLGILGMKERASLLGGEILFETAPGKGTTVTVRVPTEKRAI